MLCLAFIPSCHLKNENNMFIIIHGNSSDTEKVSLFPPSCSIFISFGKDYAILCLGSNPLNCCFATEFTGRQSFALASLVLICRLNKGLSSSSCTHGSHLLGTWSTGMLDAPQLAWYLMLHVYSAPRCNLCS